ncbi:hypothetical protein Naga_100119g2 [Nannochloropsis gaditana]|uniref:Fungal lipase-like domain-containing protein n=1 Tax=Nannochloropsis gaditana TaxID=72520 RepID=W7U0G1_9STRA|nr:hypothetical protein Naga_100119g2 [Nannochloropsis gaditana]
MEVSAIRVAPQRERNDGRHRWDTWTQLLLHSQLASTTRNNLPAMKHSQHWRGGGNLFVARQVAAEGITDAEGLGGRSSARRRGRFSSTRVTGLSSASLVQVAVGVILIISTAGAVSSHPPWTDSSPFQILSEWLDRSADSDLKGAGPPNIERAFKVVASSQQALKTMDGAAHSLYAYSHPRPPVTAWSRLEYSRASKAEKEMRLKAFRKAKLLEEAVYSSELAELSADGVGRREALTMVSELQSTQEVLAEDFLSVEGGTFRFLLLVDRDSRRLTLSVGDSLTWAQRLDVLRAPPLTVPLRPRGLLRRSMMVNPRLWAAAVTVIERVKAVLTTALRETCPGYALHVVGFSLGGSAHDNVTAFVFAPSPCISKNIRGLRRFTTSFILGDDMMPRATALSIKRLEKRLLDYVSEGDATGIYFDYARSWMKGVVGATLQQVVTHQVTKKEEEEDEGGMEALTLPGRVYYIKPRKLHGGATIKEVMRGNLREDVLWQIHDIFVSQSMLKHHSLDKYITVLARIPV